MTLLSLMAPSTSRTKKIAILQSNYIPWKGYFDVMAAVDEFLIFDEVQFTKNDWRNRNRIVLNGRLHWLTIPVRTSGAFGQPINCVEIASPDWANAHWETLKQGYRRAPHFSEIAGVLQAAYGAAASLGLLADVNELFLRAVAGYLDLTTQILRAEIVQRTRADPTERLVEICQARQATVYVSGPAARAYLKTDLFRNAGIALHYANYQDYSDYPQGVAPFEHGVSIVDALFQCGRETRSHLKSLQDRRDFLDPA